MTETVSATIGEVIVVEMEPVEKDSFYRWNLKRIPTGLQFLEQQVLKEADNTEKQRFLFITVSGNGGETAQLEFVLQSDEKLEDIKETKSITVEWKTDLRFVSYNPNYMGAAPIDVTFKYGYPCTAQSEMMYAMVCADNSMMKYGYPCTAQAQMPYGMVYGNDDAIMKYGYPCAAQAQIPYGVVYGNDAPMKYGYPCTAQATIPYGVFNGNDAMMKYGYPCAAQAQMPYGVVYGNDAMMKYGYPCTAQANVAYGMVCENDAVMKYGYPCTAQAQMPYGVVYGNDAMMKYGYPNCEGK